MSIPELYCSVGFIWSRGYQDGFTVFLEAGYPPGSSLIGNFSCCYLFSSSFCCLRKVGRSGFCSFLTFSLQWHCDWWSCYLSSSRVQISGLSVRASLVCWGKSRGFPITLIHHMVLWGSVQLSPPTLSV